MFKMSKEAIKGRIEEVLKSGSDAEIRRRVEVCLWGLEKSKNGAEAVNQLIDELGLERYGAKKAIPV